MDASFEQALIQVWRQTLVENAKTVELGSERYPVDARKLRFLFRLLRSTPCST